MHISGPRWTSFWCGRENLRRPQPRALCSKASPSSVPWWSVLMNNEWVAISNLFYVQHFSLPLCVIRRKGWKLITRFAGKPIWMTEETPTFLIARALWLVSLNIKANHRSGVNKSNCDSNDFKHLLRQLLIWFPFSDIFVSIFSSMFIPRFSDFSIKFPPTWKHEFPI